MQELAHAGQDRGPLDAPQLVFSDGMLELWQNHYGYREVTTAGIEERNILFRNFESDQLVTGFGIDSIRQRFAAITSKPVAIGQVNDNFVARIPLIPPSHEDTDR